MKEKLCPDCKLVKSVSEFYTKKNPRWESERYDAYCKPCSLKRRKVWYQKGGREKVLANANKWRKENHELAKEKHRKWNWDSKMKAVNHYGGKCVCCGEDEPKFLAIDHVENNGGEHRKTLGNQTIYKWLRDNNYPTGFQILCHNCNMAKAFYKVCPHKI